MSPKKVAGPQDEESRGVLDDAASLDTAGIGILGNTAQVSVSLPVEEDDDLADDGIVEGEVVADLIIDEPPAEDTVAAEDAPLLTSIVIEVPELEDAVTEPAVDAEPVPDAEASVDAEPIVETADAEFAEPAEAEAPAEPVLESDAVLEAEPAVGEASPSAVAVPADEPKSPADDPFDVVAAEAAAAAAFIARAKADLEAKATAHMAPARSQPARSQTPEKEEPAVDASPDKRITTTPAKSVRAEVALTSKRLDDLGEAARESADLLTADRLLDPHQQTKPEPEGAWSHFLYTVSGRRINIGDGRRARERKALSARIAAPLAGGARFVPVLSRKGGVGKTTITALLGMALADAREDRVIAVDANPDRGTLADRVVRPHHNKSVRDLVRIHGDVKGYHDLSAIVARDATRLDVLASDADPRIAEAFSDSDYRDVAGVAAHYYSLVLTDTGTGIVHSVMSATLDLADQIVIVSGLSVDEARLASETLTWLETNGYAEQAREAIVVLNQSTPGAPLVRLNELESHFGTRAKRVVRMPYDAQIAGGGTIVFANLQPETRIAARELAALLVEGLRAKAA